MTFPDRRSKSAQPAAGRRSGDPLAGTIQPGPCGPRRVSPGNVGRALYGGTTLLVAAILTLSRAAARLVTASKGKVQHQPPPGLSSRVAVSVSCLLICPGHTPLAGTGKNLAGPARRGSARAARTAGPPRRGNGPARAQAGCASLWSRAFVCLRGCQPGPRPLRRRPDLSLLPRRSRR